MQSPENLFKPHMVTAGKVALSEFLTFTLVVTGYLYYFTAFLTKDLPETSEGKKTKINLLKAITKPFTSKIIKVC